MRALENRYLRLFYDIGVFALGTVLAKAIQFVLMPLYTSYMSTEMYGTAELINNLSELFLPIVTLCIYEAAFRFAVEKRFSHTVIAKAAARLLGVSLALGAVTAYVGWRVLGYPYAFHLLLIVYAYAVRMTAAFYVRGKGLSRVFALSGVVNAIALALCNVLLIIVVPLGVDGYLLSIGCAYLATAVYLVAFGGIHRDLAGRERPDRQVARTLLAYSAPLIFYNVLYWVNTIAGRYVLLWFTNEETVGVYVAAIKIAAVINMLQQAVYVAFQLSASREFSNADRTSYYARIIDAFSGAYFALGALVICTTPLLAALTLKNDFIAAERFLPVIILAAVVNCVSSLVGTMYMTYMSTGSIVPVSVMGAAINVAACLILVPRMGVWGVCIATLVSYVAQLVYKIVDVRRLSGLVIRGRLIAANFAALTAQALCMGIEPLRAMRLHYLIAGAVVLGNGYGLRAEATALVAKLQRRGKR